MKFSFSSDRDREETSKGWDRQRLPDCFFVLVEKYILKPWSGNFGHSKSPATRRKAWQKFVVENCENRRKTLFQFLARNQTNQDGVVKARYEERLKWFHSHYVSSLKVCILYSLLQLLLDFFRIRIARAA